MIDWMHSTSKGGRDGQGQIIIGQIKCHRGKEWVITMAQITRIFMGKLLKASMPATTWKHAKSLYLMTSDVDLFPLSAKMYHEMAHDWYLVNPTHFAPPGWLYVALSSIGGYAQMWDELFTEKDFGVDHFDSEGIEVVVKFYEDRQKHVQNNHFSSEWYMDQYIAQCEKTKKTGKNSKKMFLGFSKSKTRKNVVFLTWKTQEIFF